MSEQPPGDAFAYGPDSRFPQRPQHPDFRRLAMAVSEADSRSDAGATFEQVVEGAADPATVEYMAQQRALRATTAVIRGTPDPRLMAMLKALWADAFIAGVRFQQNGGHQPEPD